MFDDSQIPDDPVMAALMSQQIAAAHPNQYAMIGASGHEDEAILGGGCDSQSEFEFTLDLNLDGLSDSDSPSRVSRRGTQRGCPIGTPSSTACGARRRYSTRGACACRGTMRPLRRTEPRSTKEQR